MVNLISYLPEGVLKRGKQEEALVVWQGRSGKIQCVGKLAVPGYSDVAIPNVAIRDVANSRLGFCSR